MAIQFALPKCVGRYALHLQYIIINVSILKRVLIHYNDVLFHNVIEFIFCTFVLHLQ